MEENINSQQTSSESDEGQLVVFGLGDEEFGINIHAVREIVRLPEITPIPRSPEYTSGICNLRGSVLPVIDTRCRFDMDTVDSTDDTRMLVVESHGTATGIIVDGMREVLRLHGTSIEDTPGVCRGVNEEFLSGVVTLDGGKRLIMTLNLEQVIDIKIDEDGKGLQFDNRSVEETAMDNDLGDEEQLVSFQVGSEEYALDILAVREILRVSEITEVPNVPDYVKGLFTIRKRLMPVVDLRTLLGMKAIAEQHINKIDALKSSHNRWASQLRAAMEGDITFTGEINAQHCDLGYWLDNFNTASQDIQDGIKEIREPHARLHDTAAALTGLVRRSKEDALANYEKKLEPLLSLVYDHLDNLKELIINNINEDQRILVVDDGDLTVGYLVDHVNEVIRVSKSIINETPTIASTQKNEIKGVAKLEDGKRLILIMDQGSILSGTETDVLSDVATAQSTSSKHIQEEEMAEGDQEQKTLAEQSLEEEQLVTFLLDKEEYGLRIMDVQEINRLETITDVPKAPFFIDGVTNLRGNIIPVLNIRTLFGKTAKENDDKTRIIIVDINNNKTGILVDQVNEVMRLSKSNIDQTPAIVSGVGNQFMDGICKLQNGERMITLINISQLLSSNELDQFDAMDDKKQKSVKKTAPKTVTKKTAKPEKGVIKKKMKIAE